MDDDSVNLTLTDIPYEEVNRESNGLRNLDKDKADIKTFDLKEFLPEIYRVTKSTIIIFCGKEQLSEIHKFFSEKQKQHKGTVRQLIWQKTNPSPMNGQHILNSIENAKYEFPEKYFEHSKDSINLYIDKAVQEGYDTEIFMDVNLKHYPLRDYKNMWSEMNNIVKDYSKIGKRNKNAIEHDKLGKHMMHLVRLYIMALDILEKGEIITYREKEHDFLMDIRNGKYLDNNRQPIPEFFELVDEYEKKLNYAKENTDLPDNPNYKEINEFVMSVNERVVRGEI